MAAVMSLNFTRLPETVVAKFFPVITISVPTLPEAGLIFVMIGAGMGSGLVA
jgi:hypothetical protein